MHSKASSGQRVNRVDDSSDEDSDTEIDPSRPWLAEFNSYFRTHEIVPEGMSIVTWWGVGVAIFSIRYISDFNSFS